MCAKTPKQNSQTLSRTQLCIQSSNTIGTSAHKAACNIICRHSLCSKCTCKMYIFGDGKTFFQVILELILNCLFDKPCLNMSTACILQGMLLLWIQSEGSLSKVCHSTSQYARQQWLHKVVFKTVHRIWLRSVQSNTKWLMCFEARFSYKFESSRASKSWSTCVKGRR